MVMVRGHDAGTFFQYECLRCCNVCSCLENFFKIQTNKLPGCSYGIPFFVVQLKRLTCTIPRYVTLN